MRPSARAFAEPGAHLGDGADRPHAQRSYPPRRGSTVGERVEQRRAARACARRPRRDGARPCASSPRAIGPVSARSAPSSAHCSRWRARAARAARGRRRPWRPAARRAASSATRKFGRDRGRRVVGGAVLGRDAGRRACPSARRRARRRSAARASRAAVDRRAGAARARSARAPVGTDISGCRRERLAAGEARPGRSRRSSGRRSGPAGRRGRGGRDLAVGHAQQDDLGRAPAPRLSAPATRGPRRAAPRPGPCPGARRRRRRRRSSVSHEIPASGPVLASRYRLG